MVHYFLLFIIPIDSDPSGPTHCLGLIFNECICRWLSSYDGRLVIDKFAEDLAIFACLLGRVEGGGGF